jgi:hypothetical protein
MAIWARYRWGQPEKVDDRDSEHLLHEYRLRFRTIEDHLDANHWKLWRGARRDEPTDSSRMAPGGVAG